jgi:DNA helicase HerA-like ATPase
MEEDLKCKDYTYLLNFQEECSQYVENNKEELCLDGTIRHTYKGVCEVKATEEVSEVSKGTQVTPTSLLGSLKDNMGGEQTANILLLSGMIIAVIIGYIGYIIFKGIQDKKKDIHKLRIQFPNPEHENEFRYKELMTSFFNSVHKLLQQNRMSVEVHKVKRKIELFITYNNKQIEKSLKGYLTSIEGVVLEEVDNYDPIDEYEEIFANRMVLSQDFYPINTDHKNFYKVFIDYLSSLEDNEQASLTIRLRPTQGKEEKVRSQLQKKDKTLAEDQSYHEIYKEEKDGLLRKSQHKMFLADIDVLGNTPKTRDGLISVVAGLGTNKNSLITKKGRKETLLKNRFIPFETLLTPFFRKKVGSYLNAEELATIIHPAKLERGKYQTNETIVLEASPEFVEEMDDNTWIGESVMKTGKHVNVYLPTENLDRHVYLAGSTGMGKSTVLIKLFLSLAEKKKDSSLVMFDPHGEDLLKIAFRLKDWSRVIYFNLAESTKTFTFNPLFSFKTSLKDKDNRTEQIYKIIAEEAEKQNKDMGTSIQKLIKFLIQTSVHFPDAYFKYLTEDLEITIKEAEKIVRERQITFADFPYILRRGSVYQSILKTVFQDYPEDIALKWLTLEEWYTPNKSVLDGVENRLSFVVQDSLIDLFEATRFDITEAVDESKIVLMPLSEQSFGKISKKLVTKFFLNELWTHAQSKTTAEERSDAYVFIDEFQEAQLDIVDDLLAQARKYKIRLILANQFLGQLWENIRKSVMGNVSTLFSFKVQNLEEAETISPLFKNKIQPEDIASLPKFNAYLRTLDTGGRDDVAFMSFKTVNYEDQIPEKHNFDELLKLNEKCLEKYGEDRKRLKQIRLFRIKNPQEYFLDLAQIPTK